MVKRRILYDETIHGGFRDGYHRTNNVNEEKYGEMVIGSCDRIIGFIYKSV